MNDIKLILGDCLEKMKDIKDHSVDMVLADLPYGTTQIKWDVIIPFDLLWDQYHRIIKPHCPIILFGREPFTSVMVSSNIKEYKHKWVWNKKQSGGFQLAKYMPLQIEEDLIVFCKGRVNYYPIMRKGEYRRKGGNKVGSGVLGNFDLTKYRYSDEYFPTNIIDLYNKRIPNSHPTQKPVELCEYMIKTYTKENDVVLDNVMGHGTTGIACLKTNRNFIGIEKDIYWFERAKSRISSFIEENR